MDLIYLLGRFHVVVLHLPLGIIVALFVLELLSRREKYRQVDQKIHGRQFPSSLAGIVPSAGRKKSYSCSSVSVPMTLSQNRKYSAKLHW